LAGAGAAAPAPVFVRRRAPGTPTATGAAGPGGLPAVDHHATDGHRPRSWTDEPRHRLLHPPPPLPVRPGRRPVPPHPPGARHPHRPSLPQPLPRRPHRRTRPLGHGRRCFPEEDRHRLGQGVDPQAEGVGAEATRPPPVAAQAVLPLAARLLRHRPARRVPPGVERRRRPRAVGDHEAPLAAVRGDRPLGEDPPGVRPRPRLVVAPLFEARPVRVAVAVQAVVPLPSGQRLSRGPLPHGVAGVTEDVVQPFGFAEVLDGRHSQAVVGTHRDADPRPGRPELGAEGPQEVHRPQAGVAGPGPQPDR
jgi:hypothetical protein